MSDVTIPEDVMAAAVATQNAAIERCLKAKLAASEYPYASGAAKEALDEEIARAILAERERCAKVAEAAIEGTDIERGFGFAQRVAQAIRSSHE